jgi:RNA polymerase sigma-70 factor (ECF subfamily)
VARIVGRFFNRPERVEEVVQEVFLKVYFALPDYSPERGSSFVAWLARVTINTCYDELRRARRRPESAMRDVTEEEAAALNARLRRGGDAESLLISRDLAAKLLDHLTPEDRLVLTLLNAEDMPASDIAGITGWTVSKVKVRAHRARAALRRVLSEFI